MEYLRKITPLRVVLKVVHLKAVMVVTAVFSNGTTFKATILLQLLDFALEFRFVLKVIVTRPAAQDFAAFPILKDTVHVFASNSSHGREVALADLMLNDDAVRSDLPLSGWRGVLVGI